MNNCSATNALDHVMYFRRIRHVHTRPIYCTFDDDIDTGACPLIESDKYIYKWEKQIAERIPIQHDVTTGLSGGKVLWLNTTIASDRYGTVGEITTPLLNTTGKCLMLFLYVWEDFSHYVLHVIEENLEVVFSKDLSLHAYNHRNNWWPYFFNLPSGLHWIKLTVQGKRLSFRNFNMIDDFSIRPCEDYKRECLLSSIGLEYMGQVSHTIDGTQCTKWGDIKENEYYINFYAENGIKVMLAASEDDYFKLQATHWQNTSSCHGARLSYAYMACNVTTDQP
jgi:hypothetical protein